MNPIMQQLKPANGIIQNLQQLKALANGSPQAAFSMLMNNNPQFRQFVQQNQGKSPEQIAQENGIDLNQIKQFLN